MGERIIAIDPGERVGWATARVSGSANLIKVEHGITDWMEFCDRFKVALDAQQRALPWDTMVFEEFRLRPAAAKFLIGSDMQTCQCVGVIRFLARHAGLKIVAQGPNCQSTGDKVAQRSVRRILDNLPAKHDESHDGSALKHLAFYHFNEYRRGNK